MLNITADGSFMKNSQITVSQAGVRAGIRFPGYSGVTVTSGIAMLNTDSVNDFIFSENVFFRLNSKTFMEGNVAWGNMDFYNDYDALYVYNSIDPLYFRASVTAYFLAGNRITIWMSLGTEEKKYYETNLYKYNQFSFLGGIRWRL
jgi:hypothetical protein